RPPAPVAPPPLSSTQCPPRHDPSPDCQDRDEERHSALRAADDQLVMVRLFGREPYAFAALRAFNGLVVRAHVVRPFGRIVRSARARRCSRRGKPLAEHFEDPMMFKLLLKIVEGCA